MLYGDLIMSSNNEEIRRKVYVTILRGARVTHANNNGRLSSSPCSIFPNKHMQTKAEIKIQPTCVEIKK